MGLAYLKYLIFMLCFLKKKKMNNALLSTGFQRREGDAKGPAEAGMGYHWEWHIPLTTLDQIGKHFIKACYSTICQLYLKIKRLQVEPLQAVHGIIINSLIQTPLKSTKSLPSSSTGFGSAILENELLHCSIPGKFHTKAEQAAKQHLSCCF